MPIIIRFVERFRDAGWLQRVLLLAALVAVLATAAVIVRTLLIPFLIRLYCWFVQIAVTYCVITAIVFALSPPTGKKLFRLGWLILERVALDPVLALLNHKQKQDDDAA